LDKAKGLLDKSKGLSDNSSIKLVEVYPKNRHNC
jgi:hypothetical protein